MKRERQRQRPRQGGRSQAVEMSIRVTTRDGVDYVESRARGVGRRSPIPKGKVLVSRTPVLPPGASEEEILALSEEELIDDDSDEAFCPLCQENHAPGATGHGPVTAHELEERPGRNDPCLCGSGRKFKKCCLWMFESRE